MSKKISDLEIDKVTKETGDVLKETDKVKIKIPKDPLNPKDSQVIVGINGYNYVIKRGETVSVPEEVARILEESNYI